MRTDMDLKWEERDLPEKANDGMRSGALFIVLVGTSCNRQRCAATTALWRETSSIGPHPGTPGDVVPSAGKPLTGKLVRAVCNERRL
jgi:hypothetical protein